MEIEVIREKLIPFDKVEEALALLKSLTERLSDGLTNRVISLINRLSRVERDYSDGLISLDDHNLGRTNIVNNILALLKEIQDLTNENGTVEVISKDTLVENDSFPFVDRLYFRNELKEILQLSESKMIFIKGERQSGMSYLEKYLMHLSKRNGIYEVVSIEIPHHLDNEKPFKGAYLAKLLSVGLGLDVDLDKDEEDQFKFVRFTTKMKEIIKGKPSIPIVFLHDFHRMAEVTEDLYKFIFNVATALRNNFPKSIFIVAGLNYELLHNWHNDLKRVCPVYTIEPIDEQSLKDCLSNIYRKYKDKIFKLGNNEHITEYEYIEGVLNRLIPEKPKINLPFIGSEISDQLDKIKNIS